MKHRLAAIITAITLAFGPLGPWAALPAHAATLSLSLASFATGFTSPVDVVNTGVPGDTRLFVVEQPGVIKIVQSNGTVLGTPFLDINALVTDNGGEQGLLGLAFHPNYASNGLFYVYYINNKGDIIVSRFSRSAGDANVANPSSEEVVIAIGHPGQTNHNGGNLMFHNGYLYIGTGDGGGGGDPANNSQNKYSLLGKILRLSLDGNAFPGNPLKHYVIPPSNPFVGKAGAPEIWAMGLRNPWRWSFDPATAAMFIGDVGQGLHEEVDIEPAISRGGKNYGWRCYEGAAAYDTTGCAPQSAYDQPVATYDHVSGNCSITGGYVYRGGAYPAMQGYYIYTDYCSGITGTLNPVPGGGWQQTVQTTFTGHNISSFGEDINHELYATDLATGNLYQVQETSNPSTFPVYRLSNYLTKERLVTASSWERDAINGQNGWNWEGVAFMAAKSTATGAYPIYRLSNYLTKERLFTASTAERDAINGHNGWNYENVAFYGVPSGGGATPVYRMANYLTKERLFTASTAERDAINGQNGWVYDGIGWYAP